FHPFDGGEVNGIAGEHHGLGKVGGFFFIHPLKINGHQHGGHLVVGYFAVAIAADEKVNFFGRQRSAVFLLYYKVIHSHTHTVMASTIPWTSLINFGFILLATSTTVA